MNVRTHAHTDKCTHSFLHACSVQSCAIGSRAVTTTQYLLRIAQHWATRTLACMHAHTNAHACLFNSNMYHGLTCSDHYTISPEDCSALSNTHARMHARTHARTRMLVQFKSVPLFHVQWPLHNLPWGLLSTEQPDQAPVPVHQKLAPSTLFYRFKGTLSTGLTCNQY